MYARTEYEMSEDELAAILEACRPVPVMMIGGTVGPSQQENANRAWAALGEKMGFDPMTVCPATGKGQRFFTAVPNETAEARKERKSHEAEAARAAEIVRVNDEIARLQARLEDLARQEPSQ
jgi:hypothetical protein